eukprot:jgi/Galph1/2732/GphlegSOOS_G1383.1
MSKAIILLLIFAWSIVFFWTSKKKTPYDFEQERSRFLRERSDLQFADLNKASSLTLNMSLLWLSQFQSATGFSTEAFAFIEGLEKRVANIDIYQFDGEVHEDYVRNLDPQTLALMKAHWMDNASEEKSLSHDAQGKGKKKYDVVVFHSVAHAWQPHLYTNALYRVGRTMFETNGIPEFWQTHLNYVDEIWVPSRFNAATFAKAGVDPRRIHIVPQAIVQRGYDNPDIPPLKLPSPVRKDDFVFLSVFKWEPRKGVDILLDAYFREFRASDPVCLVILTRKSRSNASVFTEKISRYVDTLGVPLYDRARFLVLEPSLPTRMMPALYRRSNAFVLPSRGEGWGRPLMEAMLVNVPVIATNWSGITEFLREDTGYPISVERLEEFGIGDEEQRLFWGQLWARASASHLRKLMRRVIDYPEEAALKAERARKEITEKYNPNAVADIVVENLRRIQIRLEMEGRK